MKNQQEKYHAKLIINDLPTMSSYNKSKMIKWLFEIADSLKDSVMKRDGISQEEFSKVYTLKLIKINSNPNNKE